MLYSPKISKYIIEKTKLLKYHFSENHAVFFFLYRYPNNDNFNKLQGFQFFIIISEQELS